MGKKAVVALIGNPNAGKSSLFNQLTGLRQKIGNFPGVTVDKKIGFTRMGNEEILVLDLPGTYSLFPNSLDEQVVLETLIDPTNPDKPDLAVVVVDASNLKRNLLLFEEIADLGIPTILALNMLDVASEAGLEINSGRLSRNLGVPVVELNAREGIGVEGLKLNIYKALVEKPTHINQFNWTDSERKAIEVSEDIFGAKTDYWHLQVCAQTDKLKFVNQNQKNKLSQISDFESSSFQERDIVRRYRDIERNLEGVMVQKKTVGPSLSEKIDKILLHKFWGVVAFFVVLICVFQSVFSLAQWPMDLIDQGFGQLSEWLKNVLPQSRLTDLLTDGLLAGIGGVVVFIPQIALLFSFIIILEESGYMARVVVMMDKLIRKFGLSGRSVVPLISSVACAVPAIMSARTIGNFKDRLITILVTPLMPCAARLPIYTILIAMVVPDQKFLGFFNFQGLALLGLYLMGFMSALTVSYWLKKFYKTSEPAYFIMELPTYKPPRWKNVGIEIFNKIRTFVFEAGKVIVAISIVLWALSSFGPGNEISKAEASVALSSPNYANEVASAKLEASYAGRFGKFIEPAIVPLGYDWKIGIALMTSFAAREVFVGTVSTIYSMGSDSDNATTLKSRLQSEVNALTGKKQYRPSVVFSLLFFYAFAMMCMSTMAVTYRETKGWKWPLIQFFYMTTLAYLSAFLVFQLLD